MSFECIGCSGDLCRCNNTQEELTRKYAVTHKKEKEISDNKLLKRNFIDSSFFLFKVISLLFCYFSFLAFCEILAKH